MKVVISFVLVTFGYLAYGQNSQVQVPSVISAEVKDIEDQFRNVLETECAEPRCYNIGCELGRFDTIDKVQGSSLPGLDVVEKPAQAVQYKLRSVQCAFSHEAGLTDEQVATLKQRLSSRVRPNGVTLMLNARRLPPKEDVSNAVGDTGLKPQAIDPRQDFWGALGAETIPFIPWILLVLVSTGMVLAIVWAWRRLGVKPLEVEEDGEEGDLAVVEGAPNGDGKVPVSPIALMTKLDELKRAFVDVYLAEVTLKPMLDQEKTDELCLVVKHFGSDVLSPFRKKPQYEKALLELSQAYDKAEGDVTGDELWQFLLAMERRMVAAKIRIDQQPISEEFAFLGNLELDELAGLLQQVSENEAILALTYCPRSLREKFFAACSPELMATYIERFTSVEKLPDSYAREAAGRLRKIYEEDFSSLRTVKIEQVPLLETAMNAMKPSARRELVDGLVKQTPQLIGLLSPHIVLDSSLLALPDDLLTEAFLSVSPEEAGAYLASFEEGRTVCKRLSPKLGSSIERHMTEENAAKSGRVEKARDRIAEFVKQKDAEGVISLKQINTKILSGDGGPRT